MIRSVPTAATTCCHCLAGTGMLLLALTAPLAVAQEKNSGGIYSCVDSKGRRLTSDRPIVDCLDREQKELGASGTVRRVVPPSYTAEERARLEEQRRAEELERSRIAEERRRERALLIRYPNQAMHDKERAEALKQIDEVIEAYGRLARSRADVRLVVAHGGSLTARLQEQAREAGGRIEFVGYLDRAGFRAALGHAHVFVSVPSSDGTSVALLQAMGAGAFPIVSDLPTQHEWVEDGVNGFRVPAHRPDVLAERIGRALGDAELRRRAATHNLRIHDFCSYRGLFIMTGIAANAPKDNAHIIRSADSKAALWAGAIDDIWRMGKPRGQGGPWKDTNVKAGEVSDPYLMTGYDKKSLTLGCDKDAVISAEVDLTGDGNWATYRRFEVAAGTPVVHEFPESFSAYWIRFKSEKETKATAQLDYR